MGAFCETNPFGTAERLAALCETKPLSTAQRRVPSAPAAQIRVERRWICVTVKAWPERGYEVQQCYRCDNVRFILGARSVKGTRRERR